MKTIVSVFVPRLVSCFFLRAATHKKRKRFKAPLKGLWGGELTLISTWKKNEPYPAQEFFLLFFYQNKTKK